MALQKSYISSSGTHYEDAYHVIRNIRIVRNNDNGLIPGTERGYYILVDIDVYKSKEDREVNYPMVDVIISDLGALLAELPRNFVHYIEELEELPNNIVAFAYSLMKANPMYEGAIDV